MFRTPEAIASKALEKKTEPGLCGYEEIMLDIMYEIPRMTASDR